MPDQDLASFELSVTFSKLGNRLKEKHQWVKFFTGFKGGKKKVS